MEERKATLIQPLISRCENSIHTKQYRGPAPLFVKGIACTVLLAKSPHPALSTVSLHSHVYHHDLYSSTTYPHTSYQQTSIQIREFLPVTRARRLATCSSSDEAALVMNFLLTSKNSSKRLFTHLSETYSSALCPYLKGRWPPFMHFGRLSATCGCIMASWIPSKTSFRPVVRGSPHA